MPTSGPDTYNLPTNQLAIPAVQIGSRVYTNVVVTAGRLLAVGGVSFINQESILHSFSGYPLDGASSYAGLIQGSDGSFYGTTYGGGSNHNGSVFKIIPAGLETMLYSFQGSYSECGICAAGAGAALLQGSDTNYYGTTSDDGTYSAGTVFKITSTGVETVLYSFGSGPTDGMGPGAALIQGTDGNYYSTTQFGGTHSGGTVFKITPTGVETVLYSFGGEPADGIDPGDTLIQGSDGNFYGTTYFGGTHGGGTAFKISPAGVETVLYSFGRVADGPNASAAPSALIQGSDGDFYGTTFNLGTYGRGTAFKISPTGVATVLYSFGGGAADGSNPSAALIQGSDGNFYGTTVGGGAYAGEGAPASGGTVFQITPTGVETVLHSFGGGTADGYYSPSALIRARDGNIYGTTGGGGTFGNGVVFKLTNVMPAP